MATTDVFLYPGASNPNDVILRDPVTVGAATRLARVSWAEFEVPNGPRKSQVSWAELEVPNGPRKSLVSWAELEVPDMVLRRARVSWSELEVPTAPRTARVSWSEFEVPNGPRKAQASWAELEVPNAPRRAAVSFSEFEVPPDPRRRTSVSFAEFETPDAATANQRRCCVSYAYMGLRCPLTVRPPSTRPTPYINDDNYIQWDYCDGTTRVDADNVLPPGDSFE